MKPLPSRISVSIMRRYFSSRIRPAQKLEKMLQEGNIFAEFTALASQHEAMNLGQGFPSFGSPSFLSKLLGEVCKGDVYAGDRPANLNNQYCKPGEEHSLATVLAERYSSRLHRDLNPENICTFVGAQEGLFTTMAAFCNPGDEVVVLTPAFDSYFKSAATLGINIKSVPLKLSQSASSRYPSAGEFILDLDVLRRTLTNRTKILLLNTPHSPFGKVFTAEELAAIAAVVQQFPDLLVLSDEVYEHMTYDGKPHVHIASQPGMWERTISMYSVGKTFSCTGWRVGYSIAPPELTHIVKTLHSIINFSTTTPLQKTAALAITHGEEVGYFDWLPTFLQTKRDKLCGSLEEIGIPHFKPEGGYFVVADFGQFYERAGIDTAKFNSLTAATPLAERPDVRFCKWLTKEVGVGPIPMSPFYTPDERHLANTYVRLAYPRDDGTLVTAIDRLATHFKH